MKSLISQLRYSDTAQPPHSHYHLSGEMIFVESGEALFELTGENIWQKVDAWCFFKQL